MKIFNFNRPRLQVYTDGAIRPERQLSGLAAVVVDERGHIRHWWSCQAGPMTNNEAEYAAVIFALQRLLLIQPLEIVLYSDSRTVVEQMQGRARARSENMRHAYQQARTLAAGFPHISFHHIPRERNRLADALANETADGFRPQVQ